MHDSTKDFFPSIKCTDGTVLLWFVKTNFRCAHAILGAGTAYMRFKGWISYIFLLSLGISVAKVLLCDGLLGTVARGFQIFLAYNNRPKHNNIRTSTGLNTRRAKETR